MSHVPCPMSDVPSTMWLLFTVALTFWSNYGVTNYVPIPEFESPALGLSWIPVQVLGLFSNSRLKVL